MQFIRNLLIAKIIGDTKDIIDLSEEEYSTISSIKNKTTEEHLALLLSELIKAEPAVRSALFPRTALEMTLLRLSLLDHLKTIDEALRVIKGGPAAQASRETGTRTRPAVPAGALQSKQREVRSPAASDNKPGIQGKASLSDIWNAALEKLDEDHNPLASKLKDGTVSFGEGEIRITYNNDMLMHIDSVKTSMPVINKAVNELAGKNVQIKIETAAETTLSKKDLKEKALQDPIVKEALELFEGRIVDVVPLQDTNGK